MRRFDPEKFRAIRRDLGLTGEQVGERIGVSKSAISAWERGDDVPSPENLKRAIEALGVEPEQLHSYGPGSFDAMPFDALTKEIVELSIDCSPTQKLATINLLREFKRGD